MPPPFRVRNSPRYVPPPPDTSPPVTTACYVLAWASVAGGVLLATTTNGLLGDEATLWTFVANLAPGLVSAVVLWALGGIAADVRATRNRVAPRPEPVAPSYAPAPPPIEG